MKDYITEKAILLNEKITYTAIGGEVNTPRHGVGVTVVQWLFYLC